MKKIGILSVMAMLLLAVGVSAATTVDTFWSGGGFFGTTFVSGNDAQSVLSTQGAGIMGEFHATDYDDNPYTYGVDSFNTWSKAAVSDGWIQSTTDRLDSKTSMYGAAGQQVYSYVGTSGVAEYAYNTNTNYASMGNNQYGQPTWTTNGYQMQANGAFFEIEHQLTDASGDGANLYAIGSGFGGMKLMASNSGGSAFNFGHLPVAGHGEAWDNNFAEYDGNGAGIVTLSAWADNSLDLHDFGMHIPGDTTDNSAKAFMSFTYAGSFNFKDFGVKGN